MKIVLKCIAFLSLLLFHPKQAQAQEYSNQRSEETLRYAPATGVKGSLLGSIIYPGFKIGVEKPYKFTQVNKYKIPRTKTSYQERYVSYSLGMYHHPNYHTNIFSQVDWIGRRQKRNGFYLESSFGLGISRTFVGGAAYTVLDNGDVEKKTLSGNWYGLASLGGGIGYNANLKKQKLHSIFLKHHWLLIFPYNAFITPRPTIELGVNYNISGFWEAAPTFNTKEKQSRKF